MQSVKPLNCLWSLSKISFEAIPFSHLLAKTINYLVVKKISSKQ